MGRFPAGGDFWGRFAARRACPGNSARARKSLYIAILAHEISKGPPEMDGPFDAKVCLFRWCGQWDSNPHGCPLAPKTSASANSAML